MAMLSSKILYFLHALGLLTSKRDVIHWTPRVPPWVPRQDLLESSTGTAIRAPAGAGDAEGGLCGGSLGETHPGRLFFPSQFTCRCVIQPQHYCWWRDCQGIFFKWSFQMLPSHSFTFYISLLEMGNWNLFPPSGECFLPPFSFIFFFSATLYCLSIWWLLFHGQPVSSWNETSKGANSTLMRWGGC